MGQDGITNCRLSQESEWAGEKDISEGNDLAIQEAPVTTTINSTWKDVWRNWLCVREEFDFGHTEFQAPWTQFQVLSNIKQAVKSVNLWARKDFGAEYFVLSIKYCHDTEK